MVVAFPENANIAPANVAEQVVFDFLTQMGPTLDDCKRDYRERMTDDVIWDNVGFPVIKGIDACVAHLDTLKQLTGMEYCTIEIYNLASAGNVVLTERLDTMYRDDDSVILPYRIMGAFEVRDGKICRYTDYFDTEPTRGRSRSCSLEFPDMSATLDSRPPVVAAPRTTSPVKFWALVGCLLWAFQIYVLLRWLTGPFFTPVESGPDSPPTLIKVGIITVMVVQAVAFVGLAYVWIIRPLRRERRIGFDGMVFIAFIGFYWFWDPIGNYFALTSSYNAWIPNMGSWVNDIPGWRSPGSPGHQMPEPWLVVGPGYAVYGTVMVVLSCWLMRQIRARWPRTGTWGLLIIVFVVMFVLETIMEMSGTRVGVWAYGGTNGLPTLFPDRYYRYPLTESLWGAAITAVAYMRWSRDDKGESIAERGLSKVTAPTIGKQAMRLMAITGCAYSLIFIVYWLPVFVLWRLQPEGWPLDLQMRSYLGSNYRCGPETKIACPNPNVPYTRPGSISITPDGKLYVPPGTKLPDDPTTFDEAKRRAGAK